MAEQGWQLPDTDLPWLHPDTITQPHYRKRAEIAFQDKSLLLRQRPNRAKRSLQHFSRLNRSAFQDHPAYFNF